MSKDDDDFLRGTIRFEDIDVDQSAESVPDLSDLEAYGHEADAATNPYMPALNPMLGSPDATLRQQTPIDLIEASRITQERERPVIKAEDPPQVQDHGVLWSQRFSVVDAQGMLQIYMPDAGFRPGDKVEVLLRLVTDE